MSGVACKRDNDTGCFNDKRIFYMVIGGIIEIDCHGMTVDQAVAVVEKSVNSAPKGAYRVRVIHGYNGGTRIMDAIRRELGFGLNAKIIRIENGSNQGITELVLKEYF